VRSLTALGHNVQHFLFPTVVNHGQSVALSRDHL
jgi:hypothetical protein